MYFAFMKYAVDVTCFKMLGEQNSNNVEDFDCRVYFTVIFAVRFVVSLLSVRRWLRIIS